MLEYIVELSNGVQLELHRTSARNTTVVSKGLPNRIVTSTYNFPPLRCLGYIRQLSNQLGLQILRVEEVKKSE